MPKIWEMKFITCCLLLLVSEGTISFIVPSYCGADKWRRSGGCLSVTLAEPPVNVAPAEKSSYSADIPYESLPIQNVIDTLTQTANTEDHLTTGLSDEDATQLLSQVGPNALQPPKKTSIWELWVQQFDGECPQYHLFSIFLSDIHCYIL